MNDSPKKLLLDPAKGDASMLLEDGGTFLLEQGGAWLLDVPEEITKSPENQPEQKK